MTAKETQMVQEALQYYPFENPGISFIRHNENITCKVTAGGADYVLRIHAPVEGFSLKLFEHGAAEDLISGEIALLRHLSKTAPFPVQKPVKNRLGEYITVLSDGTPAELLRWLDGKTLSEEDIAQCASELGVLAAQINSAAEGFVGERISYSYDLVRRMKAFGIFSILAFIAAQHDRYWTEEWFRKSMERWTNTLFVDLLNG